MKQLTIAGLLLTAVIGVTTVQAGIHIGTSRGILSSQEKCATALNSYLSYRHESNSADAYKIQQLEDQVDALCEGYQVKLVDNNGVTTGVIELAD